MTLEEYVKTSEYLEDSEHNKELIKEFPWLTPRNVWSGKLITDCMGEDGELGFWPEDEEEHPDYDYEWTLLGDFPSGWRKSFGWEMINKINEVVKKNNLTDFYPVQIKEKFGMLRFYASCYVEEIENIIKEYENLSQITCINCGKPATVITTGWISPFCDACAEKIKGRVIPIKEYYGD